MKAVIQHLEEDAHGYRLTSLGVQEFCVANISPQEKSDILTAL